MAGRAGRVGLLIATLLLALPLAAWAGSSQSALAVSVVVSPRCAVRMPASLIPNEVSATPSRESVAMRCTKGALPSGAGSGATATTVGPRITRDLLLAATPAMAAPRPLTETSPSSAAEVEAPRVVITVNF
ncbi:MAG: hypothetical protein ACREJY_06970 [Candidatus Rokuibacteriota bacterium]